MYFSIRCSVNQCTFTMQLMNTSNYFYTLKILTISVSNVHLCTSSCSFFLSKVIQGFIIQKIMWMKVYFIQNNVFFNSQVVQYLSIKCISKLPSLSGFYTLQKRKFRIYDLQISTSRFLLCLLLQKKFVTTWIPYHLIIISSY